MYIVMAVLLVGCGGVLSARAFAQAPANSNAPQNNSTVPADKPKNSPEANPFPDDTNVPVLPSANSPGTAASAPDDSNYSNVPLPSGDGDPVKSPDDGTPSNVESGGGSSSSNAGMDNLLKPPPDESTDKHRKLSVPDQPHTETAKEDETVGSYYLDQKNWKAALSRFESAVVLDPENPDVYWGLAEAQRHTGDYAGAKANYLKVTEYDPDSKHSKESKKILKEPEIESAKAVSATAPASPRQQ
jgi:tetratricopeptide (TPR) repeat protein